jgi:hypothetical protein
MTESRGSTSSDPSSQFRKSLDSFDVPPPLPVDTPVSMHLETPAEQPAPQPASQGDASE